LSPIAYAAKEYQLEKKESMFQSRMGLMNQAPSEDKSNPYNKTSPYRQSFTRYKGGLDESSPYNQAPT
jgi:hypothetical protein